MLTRINAKTLHAPKIVNARKLIIASARCSRSANVQAMCSISHLVNDGSTQSIVKASGETLFYFEKLRQALTDSKTGSRSVSESRFKSLLQYFEENQDLKIVALSKTLTLLRKNGRVADAYHLAMLWGKSETGLFFRVLKDKYVHIYHGLTPDTAGHLAVSMSNLLVSSNNQTQALSLRNVDINSVVSSVIRACAIYVAKNANSVGESMLQSQSLSVSENHERTDNGQASDTNHCSNMMPFTFCAKALARIGNVQDAPVPSNLFPEVFRRNLREKLLLSGERLEANTLQQLFHACQSYDDLVEMIAPLLEKSIEKDFSTVSVSLKVNHDKFDDVKAAVEESTRPENIESESIVHTQDTQTKSTNTSIIRFKPPPKRTAIIGAASSISSAPKNSLKLNTAPLPFPGAISVQDWCPEHVASICNVASSRSSTTPIMEALFRNDALRKISESLRLSSTTHPGSDRNNYKFPIDVLSLLVSAFSKVTVTKLDSVDLQRYPLTFFESRIREISIEEWSINRQKTCLIVSAIARVLVTTLSNCPGGQSQAAAGENLCNDKRNCISDPKLLLLLSNLTKSFLTNAVTTTSKSLPLRDWANVTNVLFTPVVLSHCFNINGDGGDNHRLKMADHDDIYDLDQALSSFAYESIIYIEKRGQLESLSRDSRHWLPYLIGCKRLIEKLRNNLSLQSLSRKDDTENLTAKLSACLLRILERVSFKYSPGSESKTTVSTSSVIQKSGLALTRNVDGISLNCENVSISQMMELLPLFNVEWWKRLGNVNETLSSHPSMSRINRKILSLSGVTVNNLNSNSESSELLDTIDILNRHTSDIVKRINEKSKSLCKISKATASSDLFSECPSQNALKDLGADSEILGKASLTLKTFLGLGLKGSVNSSSTMLSHMTYLTTLKTLGHLLYLSMTFQKEGHGHNSNELKYKVDLSLIDIAKVIRVFAEHDIQHPLIEILVNKCVDIVDVKNLLLCVQILTNLARLRIKNDGNVRKLNDIIIQNMPETIEAGNKLEPLIANFLLFGMEDVNHRDSAFHPDSAFHSGKSSNLNLLHAVFEEAQKSGSQLRLRFQERQLFSLLLFSLCGRESLNSLSLNCLSPSFLRKITNLEKIIHGEIAEGIPKTSSELRSEFDEQATERNPRSPWLRILEVRDSLLNLKQEENGESLRKEPNRNMKVALNSSFGSPHIDIDLVVKTC